MLRRSFLFLPALGLLPETAGQWETVPSIPATNRLVFGGDVMLSRYVGTLAAEKHDPAWPLRDIAGLFSGADLAFVNLESPFSDHGKPTTKGMIFRTSPEMIAGLELAGIDVVSTANNHARDCNGYGIDFTVDLLTKHGIAAIGTTAREGVVLERHGVRFGFLAYTFDQSNGNYKDKDERVAMLDSVSAARDIAALSTRADVVIVSMHAGTEYQPKPNAQQQEFARAAIDAGAMMVIGHHPHVVQTVEERGRGVIFYSLGNLVFDQFQRKETQKGLVVEALFISKTLVKYNLIPIDIVRTVPRVAQVS